MEKLTRIGEFVVIDSETREEVIKTLMDKGFVIAYYPGDDDESDFEVLKKK